MHVDRALVRRRRAWIRGSGDEDDDAATVESRERLGRGRDAGGVPDVVAVLRETRNEVRPRDRSERDHEIVGVDRLSADSRGARDRVDRVDLVANEPDAALAKHLA